MKITKMVIAAIRVSVGLYSRWRPLFGLYPQVWSQPVLMGGGVAALCAYGVRAVGHYLVVYL